MRNFTNSKCGLRALAASAACLLVACAAPVTENNDDGAAASDESALRNGVVLANGAPWAGVVRVEFYNYGDGMWHVCTGQVTSRNTVVTAGHCPIKQGMTGLNGHWLVVVTRQTAAGGIRGEWLTPYGSYINAEITVHPNYPASGYDIAVVRSPTDWANTVQNDAAGIAKTHPNNQMWAFGYGNYGEDLRADYDFQARAAQLVVTYDPNYSEYANTSSGSSPQLCAGDSGGPLKTSVFSGSLMYGVAAHISVEGGACGDTGYWETVGNNWRWLAMNIGNCSDKLSFISCW